MLSGSRLSMSAYDSGQKLDAGIRQWTNRVDSRCRPEPVRIYGKESVYMRVMRLAVTAGEPLPWRGCFSLDSHKY